MQELKKILEEIKKSGITSVELFNREIPFVALSEVERIILRQMHEKTEAVLITEMCPHCGAETGIFWNVEKDGYQVFCPNCGKPMMLCSMCDRMPCDWTEKGCKYSDDRYCMYDSDQTMLEQPDTCKYTGGSCCWPIDQCGECPNHPGGYGR